MGPVYCALSDFLQGDAGLPGATGLKGLSGFPGTRGHEGQTGETGPGLRVQRRSEETTSVLVYTLLMIDWLVDWLIGWLVD